MVERARVVAEHVAIAYAEAAAFDHDDAARFERLGGLLDGFGAAVDSEVRALAAERVDQGLGTLLQLLATASWTQRSPRSAEPCTTVPPRP
jgi:hypothetical protein